MRLCVCNPAILGRAELAARKGKQGWKRGEIYLGRLVTRYLVVWIRSMTDIDEISFGFDIRVWEKDVADLFSIMVIFVVSRGRKG